MAGGAEELTRKGAHEGLMSNHGQCKDTTTEGAPRRLKHGVDSLLLQGGAALGTAANVIGEHLRRLPSPGMPAAEDAGEGRQIERLKQL